MKQSVLDALGTMRGAQEEVEKLNARLKVGEERARMAKDINRRQEELLELQQQTIEGYKDA
jgi:hypothetical protein